MSDRKPSGFELRTDRRPVTFQISLSISGIILVALFVAVAELLTWMGWPVPHLITLWIGILMGLVIGIQAGHALPKHEND